MLRGCSFNSAGKKVVVSAVLWLVSAGFVSASDDELLQRIKPVGSVCVEGQDCKKAAAKKVAAVTEAAPVEKAEPAPEVAATGPSGEEITNKNCVACHATGVAGAPKIGDAAAWAARSEKGMDGMLEVAKTGLNAMPPMGMCMTCSDEELKAAISYMMDKSK